LLPTPAARDWKDTGAPAEFTRKSPQMLPTILKLLPTPTAGEAKNARNKTSARQPNSQHHSGTTLSDVAYEWSGASMSPPSDDGKPSMDPRPRLSPEFVGWMMGTATCGACGREWTDSDCPHSATEFRLNSDTSSDATSSNSKQEDSESTMKERYMELTFDTAKAVVEKAIEHGAWDWDPGTNITDDLIASTATNLVDKCLMLSEGGNTNEGLLDILHAASAEPRSDATREAYAQRFGDVTPANGASPEQALDGSSSFAEETQPESAPASAFSTPLAREDISAMARAAAAPTESQSPASSEPAHSPAPAAGEFDINSIYPGYDDQKVADIKKAVLHFASTGELSPEEWEQIKAYEAANEERKTILSLQPEFPAPEPEPTVQTVQRPDGTSAFIGVGQSSAAPAPSTFEQRTAQEGVTITPRADGATEFHVPTGHAEEQQSATEFFANGAKEGGDSIQAFYNDETISRAAQEGLPIPPQAPEAPLVMPINITTTSSEELSRLATEYYSRFSRTEWLISQEFGRERAAEQLEQDAHRDAYNQAYENHKSAIPEGKSGPTALDAARKLAEKDADGAQAVQIWRTRKIRHGIDTNELKALARIFDKGMWRINEELERRARLATTAGGAQR
jgi:hypothetical protein